MLYSKTDTKRYTQMCKEFDKEFYTENRDDDKLFKYLYLLFYMFACKGDYFQKFEDLDLYAQYSATKIYARLIKKEKKGVKVKSILNYVKKCKGPLKIDFQNESFEQVTKLNDEDVDAFNQVYRQSLQPNEQRDDLIFDTNELLKRVPKIMKSIIDSSIYRGDRLLCKRLYTSCLLTFMSNITLPNDVIKRLNNKEQKNKIVSDDTIIKEYQKCTLEEPILWNLDDKYSNIVKMFVNKVRVKMSEEINETISSYVVPEDVIDSVLSSAYGDKIFNDNVRGEL